MRTGLLCLALTSALCLSAHGMVIQVELEESSLGYERDLDVRETFVWVTDRIDAQLTLPAMTFLPGNSYRVEVTMPQGLVVQAQPDALYFMSRFIVGQPELSGISYGSAYASGAVTLQGTNIYWPALRGDMGDYLETTNWSAVAIGLIGIDEVPAGLTQPMLITGVTFDYNVPANYDRWMAPSAQALFSISMKQLSLLTDPLPAPYVAVVPEPAGAVLACGALLGILGWRRRR